ncbi:hypothetical protein ACIP93_30730 [Streptomyces sp. NPDC088745]|uniref:hypothetical protein n=1 Tax=Streptomyces sp. NPDC088745 TaxID=3365884 RepID=UPI003823970F
MVDPRGAPLEVPHLTADDRYVLRPWELGDLLLARKASADPCIPLITTVPSACSPEAGEAFVRRQWDRAAAAPSSSYAWRTAARSARAACG